jgi:nucleotide-binding universal stress UspA family protein
MNILLAVDGSETSLRATAGLASHVRWFAEPPTIHLLHVHLPVPVGLALQHVSCETLNRYYLEEGEKVLAPAVELLRSAGLSATTHIHVGHAAELIVRLAGELACELVCLGSHGRGAIAAAVLGSVALKVLQLSPVPVLLFR